MTAQPAGPAPRCTYHHVPMHWQTSWGYPSFVCSLCMGSGGTEAFEGEPQEDGPISYGGPLLEGEPYEDTYLPGIADYDRFGRPAWGTEEDM